MLAPKKTELHELLRLVCIILLSKHVASKSPINHGECVEQSTTFCLIPLPPHFPKAYIHLWKLKQTLIFISLMAKNLRIKMSHEEGKASSWGAIFVKTHLLCEP